MSQNVTMTDNYEWEIGITGWKDCNHPVINEGRNVPTNWTQM
jgi:hypothetical protein